jgi:hypothetical protein
MYEHARAFVFPGFVLDPNALLALVFLLLSLKQAHRNGLQAEITRVRKEHEVLFLGHFLESVYFVLQLSDSNGHGRTMVLQTVEVMNLFSSLVPPCTRDAHKFMPTSNVYKRTTQETLSWMQDEQTAQIHGMETRFRDTLAAQKQKFDEQVAQLLKQQIQQVDAAETKSKDDTESRFGKFQVCHQRLDWCCDSYDAFCDEIVSVLVLVFCLCGRPNLRQFNKVTKTHCSKPCGPCNWTT